MAKAKPKPPRTFQDLIFALQNYWSDQGCIILQPYDMEMGAGTFHTATFLRAVGPEPWSAAYVQPSRRPTDGRYGNNPFRLQHYYQFQVSIKPSPDDFQDLYLGSLRALGFDLLTHDIRFVEDNWESPTLGAWGLGWEVWLNGMEVSQFTYFQQVGGLDCRPVMGEITYGLERLAMYIQGKESIFDIVWTEGPFGAITYGDVFHQNEVEQSAYNFEKADTDVLLRQFDTHETACQNLLSDKLVLPAYEQMVKASHSFNLLDARHAVSVTERQRFILRVRTLARGVAEALSREPRSARLSAAQERRRGASGLMSARDLLFELGTEELPPRTLQGLSAALTDGIVKGLDGAGIAHGAARGFATPRRLAVLVRSCAERAADRQVERRGPPVSSCLRCGRRAHAGRGRLCPQLRRPGRGSRAAGHGEGRVAGIPRHRARRRDRRLLGDIINHAIAALPIAKRMRWGARTAEFVRPVHCVVLLFGD